MLERGAIIRSLRRAERAQLILFLAISLLCLYLFQRSFKNLLATASTLIAWSPKSQVSLAGLDLYSVTTTIACPLILGGLLSSFQVIHTHIEKVGQRLSDDRRVPSDEARKTIVPIILPELEAVTGSGRLVVRLLYLLPVAALFMHAIAGLSSLFLLTSARIRALTGLGLEHAVFGGQALMIMAMVGGAATIRYWMLSRASPRTHAPLKATETAPIEPNVMENNTIGYREQSWQIFICAKRLDSNGEPTRDSELAKGLYDFLRGEGFRTFLSIYSLEQLGTPAYKSAIDAALDQADVLIAVGTSAQHLNSHWVKYEWDSFINDIISDLKPDGRVFVYVEGVAPAELPRPLRQSETFQHGPEAAERLANFIRNAIPTEQRITRITRHPGPQVRTSMRKNSSTFLWRRRAGWAVVISFLVLWTAAVFYYGMIPRKNRMMAFVDPSGSQSSRVAEIRRFQSSWIFIGYMNALSRDYIEGPYAEVAYRTTGTELGLIEPQKGDVLRILKNRRLIISEFVRRGTALEKIAPPQAHAVLSREDDTGYSASAGSLMIVRDVEISGDPGRPYSVWCRVEECRAELEPCRKAREESKPPDMDSERNNKAG